ncbi:MAG: HDIG domain-containing protein, partial [Deltaproteobacteria bacterium]|nr:HDIG domain-containing protein [Deltaproteobacteria bacterium]
ERFNPDLEERLVALLKDGLSAMIVADDSMLAKKTNIFALNIQTGKLEVVPAISLSTLAQARDNLRHEVIGDSGVSAAWRPHVLRLAEGLLTPNLAFDETRTKMRQEQDANNVDHVLRQLKKGKVVLRQGDEVGPDHLIQIEALRRLAPEGSSIRQTLGMAILVAILLFMFVFFVRLVPAEQWGYLRLAGFLVLVLTANLVLLKASWFVCESVSQSFPFPPFNDRSSFFYLLPFAYGSMLITLLAETRCAWLFLVFFTVLAAQFAGSDYSGFFYILMTNLTGILVMRKVTQRIGIIGAGFKLGLASVVFFAILQLMKQAQPDLMNGGFGAALAFLSGPVNAVFLVFTIPLCERLFMITTEIRLSELGSLNLPLIRELILKAPGTYNHSIAVGTLCEGAAKAIGLNPLFLRIAALYHDIGKAVRPEYFVENQRGANPHDRIDPQESVRFLKGHVEDGIVLARRAKLPASLADLIPQHHGTRLMRFFYEKAKAEASDKDIKIEEDSFRYDGPKPQTKAAAILMLADGIEAAARTLNDHSPDQLTTLIKKITVDATQDGQFSDCDITFLEMDRIGRSFLETLSSYYHSRIAYPGVDLEPGSGP